MSTVDDTNNIALNIVALGGSNAELEDLLQVDEKTGNQKYIVTFEEGSDYDSDSDDDDDDDDDDNNEGNDLFGVGETEETEHQEQQQNKLNSTSEIVL